MASCLVFTNDMHLQDLCLLRNYMHPFGAITKSPIEQPFTVFMALQPPKTSQTSTQSQLNNASQYTDRGKQASSCRNTLQSSKLETAKVQIREHVKSTRAKAAIQLLQLLWLFTLAISWPPCAQPRQLRRIVRINTSCSLALHVSDAMAKVAL